LRRPLYKRVLIKLSGEVLGGPAGQGIDTSVIRSFCRRIIPLVKDGIQVGIVPGAGNIFRGESSRQSEKNMPVIDRVEGDRMGMLATVINSIAFKDIFREEGAVCEVMSAFGIGTFVRTFVREEAVDLLSKGVILLFAGGTGNPFFTTDSAAALRAAEIKADVLVKTTKVDGVYDRDPVKYKDAKFIKSMTFDEALSKGIRVMDSAAFALCSENRIPVIVCNFDDQTVLSDILFDGKDKGTIIKTASGG
jgi:uridylate kinase